ncbi:ABC transporter permease [Sporolactobacillus sp. CPB3-1]|uniref:ABC transporter permease n=1 Tax=Sporolactobacillus mangiferae TaxID=2940498 RepID=A0ABT0M845_9BACL|nr:oligopeptide ABC transporter permease [Sporolactobacillus mangiferae]MCL1631042.1 ABC transporter permease [Sporolactobacillus mangiferae]
MAVANQDITKEMFLPAEIDRTENERVSGEVVSVWKDAVRRFVQNKGALLSIFIVLLIVLLAVSVPYSHNYDPTHQDLNRSNLPPRVSALSWVPFLNGQEDGIDVYQQRGIKKDFWFGTDQLGRDLWSRTWEGTRISLIIAVIAALVDVLIGVTYGGISGYFGGLTDNILQRIMEIISGIPNLVWIILLILVMKPGLIPITIAITATSWISMSRIVRGSMMKLKNQEFVLASKSLGAGNARIVFKHLIPNSLGMIIVNTMFSIPAAIFFEAFLSFIGLGIRDPQASLGSLINSGYEVLQLHPYQTVYPGLLICLLLIAFNLIGNGLRDAFDPKLRH